MSVISIARMARIGGRRSPGEDRIVAGIAYGTLHRLRPSARPSGASWPGGDDHGLLRAFRCLRASWRLRLMEEGSVELIVWARGCTGRSAIRGGSSYAPPLRTDGPARAGELLPTSGRWGLPAQLACRRIGPRATAAARDRSGGRPVRPDCQCPRAVLEARMWRPARLNGRPNP
jgi:hypothetical protein